MLPAKSSFGGDCDAFGRRSLVRKKRQQLKGRGDGCANERMLVGRTTFSLGRPLLVRS